MNKKDIEILCKIIKINGRDDLALLLDGALGELEQTSGDEPFKWDRFHLFVICG